VVKRGSYITISVETFIEKCPLGRNKTKTPELCSASELYRPSDRRLSAKLVPLGRPRRKWDDGIKFCFVELCGENQRRMELSYDCVQ
jgi:hypothetical protein